MYFLNEQDLPHLQVLDLSHNKVNSLSALHFRIGNIAKISLASNEIKSLNGTVYMYVYMYVHMHYMMYF